MPSWGWALAALTVVGLLVAGVWWLMTHVPPAPHDRLRR